MANNKLLLSLVIFLGSFFIFPGSARANLQYFGYYNVNGMPVDSRDHIPEISARGNTNIGVITVSDIPKLPQYLTEMRENKMYAILGVTAMFEQPRRQEIWTAIKRVIKGYEDVIYGFYFDESAWRGISATEFRSYTKQIRDDFPDKATILIEGYPPIAWGTMPTGYLDYITDFGFDFYSTVENTNDFEKGWVGYLQLYDKIYNLGAGKKIWLVPEGYGYPNSPTSNLAKILQRYYAHALAHPEVVGILVFSYDIGDNVGYYTLRDVMNPDSQFYNPGVIHTHNSIGRAIIANAPAYPTNTLPPSPSPSPSTSLKPGDLNADGKVNLFDFNMLISKFGNTYTILDFNAIVSNYDRQ